MLNSPRTGNKIKYYSFFDHLNIDIMIILGDFWLIIFKNVDKMTTWVEQSGKFRKLHHFYVMQTLKPRKRQHWCHVTISQIYEKSHITHILNSGLIIINMV